MEQGTARIALGVGLIDTAQEPQPVRFNPERFPDIFDGASVTFTRRRGMPDWAHTIDRA